MNGSDAAAGADATPDVEVVLRPDRRRAGLWSLVGIASLWLIGWSTTVGDLPRGLGLAFLITGTLLTLLVAIQVVAPGLWTLHVTTERVTGRVAGFMVDTDYAGCHAVDVSRRFGEPRLVLRGPRKRILVLPIGADVDTLRTVIAGIDLPPSTP